MLEFINSINGIAVSALNPKGYYLLADNSNASVSGSPKGSVKGSGTWNDGYLPNVNRNNRIEIASTFTVKNEITFGISFKILGTTAALSGIAKEYHVFLGGDNTGLGLMVDSGTNNNPRFLSGVVAGGTAYRHVTDVIPGLTDGGWHNLMASFSNTDGILKMYTDGVLRDQVFLKIGTLTMKSPIYIGCYTKTDDYSCNAALRNFRIYNRRLTDYEIGRMHTKRPN